VVVFNAADLVGASLEGLLAERQAEAAGRRRPEPERLARAEEVLERWPVPVLRGGERACYNPVSDRIALPERGCFHTAAAAAFIALWTMSAYSRRRTSTSSASPVVRLMVETVASD
jgi:antirestriction protein ArdC